MPLRVGIVGAAWGAFAHLPAWRALEGVEVSAICTSRRETALAAAERLAIQRPFWDALEMCRDPDIDIVDLGTRPVTRLPWVIEALRNGKHIYNACPHAPNWAGAQAIDDAWDRKQSRTAVDAFSRYLPAHRQMKMMIEDGFIGRTLGGACRFNLSLFNSPDKRFPYNWFADGDAGVSALRNNGGHLLYFICEFLGPVEEVIANDEIALKEWVFRDGDRIAPQNNDYANLIVRFVSGVSITFQVSWSMTAQEGWTIDLFGTDGRLRVRAPSFPTAQECRLYAARVAIRQSDALAPIELDYAERPDIALPWFSDPPPAYPMALAMQSLVEGIEGHGAARPDFAHALEVERVLEAARRSNIERRWIAVADIQ